ncbi:MAG: type II secretion system F family protein [Desulfovibrio sp.]|nr:type II secretion system F family protein [Desulfovibrio sp.]
MARLFFTPSVRARLWRKLGVLLSHGVTLHQALVHLEEQAREEKALYQPIIASLVRALGRGESIAKALDGLVSGNECLLIEAGLAGDISRAFLEASESCKEDVRLGEKIRQAAAYPLFLLVLLAAILVLFAKLVFPSLFLSIAPEALTGTAKNLYEVVTAFSSVWGLVCCGAVFFGCMAIVFSFGQLTGRIRLFLDKVFPWNCYRLRVGSRWLVGFARLLAFGVPARMVLQKILLAKSTTPYLYERTAAILRRLSQGENVGQAMVGCGFDFPSRRLASDCAFYSSVPDASGEMVSMAKESLVEVEQSIERSLRILTSLVLCLIAGCIAFLFQGLFALETQLGGHF